MKYEKTNQVLNQLVADLSQLAMIVHQTHWYMRGTNFLKLHPLMDEWMDDLNDQLDELNEKIAELTQTRELLEYKINSFDDHIAQFKLGKVTPNNVEKLWEFNKKLEE